MSEASKYPDNYFSDIMPRIRERAHDRCEVCGSGLKKVSIVQRVVGDDWSDENLVLICKEDFFSLYPNQAKVLLAKYPSLGEDEDE
jgi:hypothetical protein